MTFKHFLLVMSIGTIGAWITWTVTLFTIDPVETSIIGFLFFYLTLAVALIGSFSIAGVSLRVLIKRPNVISREVSVSFRQAIWFSILLAGSLILLSRDILYWWAGLLIIIVLSLLELFFLTAKRTKKTTNT